ncbi:HAD family hydrolase [Baekduia soli]|uniref:HAD family hydrolase n=1 Tax=Baekduia soli TaxID=496014 RepID=A0A5B8U227_9ACTN|nr:haloacid dehalogenase-like hydrolase [Baekduia soli]QEC47104.1 HAD family hydrolase [Baekduia soli]
MLLLFDIDGTLLLKASREHAEAVHAALRRVHRIEIPTARVEAAGRTDGAIAKSILTLAGVSAERIDARADDVRAATCEEFARRCPADLRDHLNPGIVEVLEGLHADAGKHLSLLTGNMEPVARLKLQRAGIAHFFGPGQGAFGSDDDDRAALPAIARARAGADGRPWPREDAVVIGDTPRDIACARADGVRVVAIATGPFAAQDLGGADAVVHRAHDLPGALEGLAGATIDP